MQVTNINYNGYLSEARSLLLNNSILTNWFSAKLFQYCSMYTTHQILIYHKCCNKMWQLTGNKKPKRCTSQAQYADWCHGAAVYFQQLSFWPFYCSEHPSQLHPLFFNILSINYLHASKNGQNHTYTRLIHNHTGFIYSTQQQNIFKRLLSFGLW